MQLEHSFTVPVGVEEAWAVLLDIERVAACMPGAALDSVDGDDFTGTVKVKLGPIGLTYKGKAAFVEKDAAAHRAVIDARGRDARGNGTASAKVTATLTEDGGSTKVDVTTELDITGKPAQFGRGVMVDVGNKLIGQFADCLAGTLGAGENAPAAEAVALGEPATPPPADGVTPALEPATTTPVAGPAAAGPAGSAAVGAGEPPVTPPTPLTRPPVSRRRTDEDIEPIDLIHSAGPAVAKRLGPLLALLVLVIVLLRRRRR